MLTLKKGVIASALQVLNQVVRRMVGIVSLTILARVLVPEDFGLVAIALIFVNFANEITQTGGGQYLLSRKDINDELVFTNWTLNFILKGCVALVLALSSFFIVDYYDDPRLQPIILVFCIQILISSLSNPHLIYKYKAQNLGAITKWQIGSRFVTTGLTVTIAIVYETYWALVIGQCAVALSSFISSYIIVPKLPRFCLKNIGPQWDFSKWLLPRSIVDFLRSQIDAIYVSGSFEKAVMGAYNSMRYYANIPASLIINPILSAALPQFSEFKDNHNYYVKQLQVTLFVLTLISALVVTLMASESEFLVGLLLGDKWVEYSSLLAICAFFNVVVSLNNIVSQVAMLKDKTKLLMFYSIGSILAQLIVFVSLDFADIYELAYTKLYIDLFLMVIFFVFVVVQLLGVGALRSISLPMLIPAVSAIVSLQGSSIIPSTEIGWIDFLIRCTVFCMIFVLTNSFFVVAFRKQVHCCGYVHERVLSQLKRIVFKN